jgi:HTH-type transcriptional regulator/antitoxin HigA
MKDTKEFDRTAVKPIRSEEQLNVVFKRIDEIIDAAPGSTEFEELDLLSELVYAYEHRYHEIGIPDPIELINAKVEDGEITLAQLQKVLPNRSTRSQVLNKRRRMPIQAALAIVERGWVPTESFFTSSYWSSFDK